MDMKLREIKHVRQYSKETFRRWFCSDYFHLYVFEDTAGSLVGFHLCYDVSGRERAIVYEGDTGLLHFRVDGGESTPFQNATPLYTSRSQLPTDLETVISRFVQESGELDPELVSWVCEKLRNAAP